MEDRRLIIQIDAECNDDTIMKGHVERRDVSEQETVKVLANLINHVLMNRIVQKIFYGYNFKEK